jgi:hypothetical protein
LNKKLTNWWTIEEDRSLILGTLKYGIGNYDEMKEDTELSFHKYKSQMEAQNEETTESQDKSALSNAWPSNRTLEAHLKLLLRTMNKSQRAQDRENRKLLRMNQKAFDKKKSQEARDRYILHDHNIYL